MNIAAHTVAKSYPLEQAEGMCRYGSLTNINPSGKKGLKANLSKNVRHAFPLSTCLGKLEIRP